jgi:hypothetical protein
VRRHRPVNEPNGSEPLVCAGVSRLEFVSVVELDAPRAAPLAAALCHLGDALPGVLGAELAHAAAPLAAAGRRGGVQLGREEALDICAGLARSAERTLAAGWTIEGLALEGIEHRLFEALIGETAR